MEKRKMSHRIAGLQYMGAIGTQDVHKLSISLDKLCIEELEKAVKWAKLLQEAGRHDSIEIYLIDDSIPRYTWHKHVEFNLPEKLRDKMYSIKVIEE